jgi:hypothetical protein
VPIVHADGTFEPRRPFEIIGGILATRSGWSPPFGVPLAEALAELEPEGRLDFGAAAEHGASRSLTREVRPRCPSERPRPGLMSFLTHLYTRLQPLGTVTAIDLAAYARGLKVDE